MEVYHLAMSMKYSVQKLVPFFRLCSHHALHRSFESSDHSFYYVVSFRIIPCGTSLFDSIFLCRIFNLYEIKLKVVDAKCIFRMVEGINDLTFHELDHSTFVEQSEKYNANKGLF